MDFSSPCNISDITFSRATRTAYLLSEVIIQNDMFVLIRVHTALAIREKN